MENFLRRVVAHQTMQLRKLYQESTYVNCISFLVISFEAVLYVLFTAAEWLYLISDGYVVFYYAAASFLGDIFHWSVVMN